MKNSNLTKNSLFLFSSLLIIFSSCSTGKYMPNDNIYGHWTGKGKFNNTKIQENIKEVDFSFTINKDNTVSGKIGNAEISKAKIIKYFSMSDKGGSTVKLVLDGELCENSGLVKKKMKIIMYVKDKNEIQTNFYYGGKIGNVTLKKEG